MSLFLPKNLSDLASLGAHFSVEQVEVLSLSDLAGIDAATLPLLAQDDDALEEHLSSVVVRRSTGELARLLLVDRSQVVSESQLLSIISLEHSNFTAQPVLLYNHLTDWHYFLWDPDDLVSEINPLHRRAWIERLFLFMDVSRVNKLYRFFSVFAAFFLLVVLFGTSFPTAAYFTVILSVLLPYALLHRPIMRRGGTLLSVSFLLFLWFSSVLYVFLQTSSFTVGGYFYWVFFMPWPLVWALACLSYRAFVQNREAYFSVLLTAHLNKIAAFADASDGQILTEKMYTSLP